MKGKHMEHFITATTADQRPAVGRKGQAIECFRQGLHGGGEFAPQVNDPNLVPSVSRMKHRCVTTRAVDREIDRKIPQLHVDAGGLDPPLVM